MKQAPFEAAHAHEWREFEEFLEKKSKTPPFPAAEMPARYRRLCQSLALAADRQYSPALVDRLNELALRGHHALYQNRRRQAQRVLEFLLAEFPALVRSEWRLVTAAAALFFGPLLGLLAILQVYPEFVHYLLAPEQIANLHEMYDPASKRLGMREAVVRPTDPNSQGLFLGEPLLFRAATWLAHGDAAADQTLVIGPLGLAAWFGLLVTALNLMPIGQLDGGHVTYALLRKRAHSISRIASWICVALVYFGPSWIVWAMDASVSIVSQVIIDWRRIGFSRPIPT